MAISWDEDHVKEAKAQVEEVIETNRKGPANYIKRTYDNFMPILLQPFIDSFDDLRPPLSWDEAEKVYTRNMQHNLITVKIGYFFR